MVAANFRLNIDDLHCHHLIFGTSADNGYARVLDQYCLDEKNSGRITLLTGPPLARELAALQDKFKAISVPNIFRSDKIPAGKVSFSQPTPPATPKSDYASMAAMNPTAQGSLNVVRSAATFRNN
jgi:hypothetical protein